MVVKVSKEHTHQKLYMKLYCTLTYVTFSSSKQRNLQGANVDFIHRHEKSPRKALEGQCTGRCAESCAERFLGIFCFPRSVTTEDRKALKVGALKMPQAIRNPEIKFKKVRCDKKFEITSLKLAGADERKNGVLIAGGSDFRDSALTVWEILCSRLCWSADCSDLTVSTLAIQSHPSFPLPSLLYQLI